MHKEGTKVRWKWGQGGGSGTIKSGFAQKTTRKIDGKEITRNGSKEDPAYYIDSDSGHDVLKLHSELENDE